MAASSSTLKEAANEVQHEHETFYKIKWVMEATGRSIPIALQGENGPCALLALLNIHLQRGVLVLPPGSQSISETRAMSMLAELALSSDAKAVQHFVELLPTLRRGMHVNVKFYAPTAFETTKEMTAFDCFPDVQLLHGWLVDPQDEYLAHAFSDLSYNQVMDELVRISALSESSRGKSSSPKTASNKHPCETEDGGSELRESGVDADPKLVESDRATGDVTVPHSGECEPDLFDVKLPNHLNAGDGETPNVIGSKPGDEAAAGGNTESGQCLDGKRESSMNGGSRVSEIENETVSGCVETTAIEIAIPDSLPITSGNMNAPEEPTSSIAEHAVEVWEFFETFPTHLTYHGIAELNGMLKDGGTCILFRNSHFYVLRKHKEDLYTLCTDVGFHRESDIVWELLRDINGDSDFYSALFHPSVPGKTGLNLNPSRNVTSLPPVANPSTRPAAGSSHGRVKENVRRKQPQNRNQSQQQIPFSRRKPERRKDENCIIQ